MTRKQWCGMTLVMLASAIVCVVALVAVVDPFEIYHRAWFYQPSYASDTQMYANAGVAKSYTYDSIIIGTSVTENCRPSVYAQALGGSFVKLCMNGGLAHDHAKMMEIAFRTHDVRRVVYGLDLFAFSQYPTNQKAVTPDYLYDDSLLNDTAYWFNESVLLRYVPEALGRIGTMPDDSARDAMYFWNPPELPGAEGLIAQLDWTAPVAQALPADALEEFTAGNWKQNLLPYIAAHRDTVFDIFFPPYSLLYWVKQAQEGLLEVRLAQREQLAAALLAEPNVRLYDFQANTAWTQNYELYFDSIHYISDVNDAMAQALAADAWRVTDVSQVKAAGDSIRRDALTIHAAHAGQ